MKKHFVTLAVVVLAIGLFAYAQPPRFGPPGREHTVTKMTSSYRLIDGNRPGGDEPSGK